MAAYIDTSLLVPLFFNENSTTVARFVMVQEALPWVSHWTLTEFACALAFKLSSSQVNGAVAETARHLFQVFTASPLTVVDILREDFANAADILRFTPAPGLRIFDALHLAGG